MKLREVLDGILGQGMAARIATRAGIVDAVAAGLAAVEVAEAKGPHARILASWASLRLHKVGTGRMTATLDTDIGMSIAASAGYASSNAPRRSTSERNEGRYAGGIARS